MIDFGLGLVILVLAVAAWLWRRRGDAALRSLQLAQVERDQTQQYEQYLSARFKFVTENIGEGIILLDRSGRITFANLAAQKFLDAPTLVDENIERFAWYLQIQPLVQEVLQQRAESLAQVVVKDDRAFQIIARAHSTESGGVLILIGEITELQRLGRVRRDFVANISHELRTPVATLRLLMDTLTTELGDESPAHPWVLKLKQQIDVLHQLTDELMDLALIESGQMPIKLVETSALELVEAVLELFRPQAERKKITLEKNVDENIFVLADPAGARRVLGNLLHNAIKFTPMDGRIFVCVIPVDDMVEFQVKDSGIGISARDLPRIFERFYRVDRVRVEGESRSTGLGLSIAKHIVGVHGGNIWAESVEGKGSVFHFTLPNESR